MASLGSRLKGILELFLYSLAGAVPVSAFFIAALFPGYSSLSVGDAGGVLIVAPIAVGTLLGALLSDYDLRYAAFAAIGTTLFASVLIAVFIYSPIIAGVAQATPAADPSQVLEVFVAQRVMLFAVLAFPILLLGTILGSALAGRILPSDELRRELQRLRAETKEWHELLERTGRMKPSEATRLSGVDEKAKTLKAEEPGGETRDPKGG